MKVTVNKRFAATQLAYISAIVAILSEKKYINFCTIFFGMGEEIKLKQVWC